MKRLLIAIMILAMVFSMAGCSSGSDENTPELTAAPSNWEIRSFVDDYGNETDDKYVFGKFEGTYDNMTRSGNSLTVYACYSNYFNHPTFRFRLLEGGSSKALHFSSDCISLHLMINDNDYMVELFGDAPSGDLVFYPTLSGYMFSEHYDVLIIEDEREEVWDEFMKALKNGETISCYIMIGDKAIDHAGIGDGNKYLFKLDGSGFAEQLALIEQ